MLEIYTVLKSLECVWCKVGYYWLKFSGYDIFCFFKSNLYRLLCLWRQEPPPLSVVGSSTWTDRPSQSELPQLSHSPASGFRAPPSPGLSHSYQQPQVLLGASLPQSMRSLSADSRPHKAISPYDDVGPINSSSVSHTPLLIFL
jgi:hypothetical protein